MSELNHKVNKATKWSALTELVSRVIAPVTSMVLARLLTPDAFGVVTSMAMIISFADIFTDAGFQKYLIQHEFENDTDRIQSTNVAFWSNFILSMFIWGMIAVFASPLAELVGNPGLGHVLVIACVAIPLSSFSSIQMALYKRSLDFKTLFKVRMVGILVPLCVTVPLAFCLRSYWALVFGTIIQQLANAVLLTVYSSWKPSLFYSFSKLKEMLSFTIWSLFESISIWLTNYVDVFIVGTMLSQYYLGLYKTSTVTVGHIMGMITAATTPILFSSLSRLQNDDTEFRRLFFRFQKLVGTLVIPISVGIFCYSDFITAILLGDQWTEASGFIGLWGLTSGIACVFWHYSSEIYRAKGRPMLSVLSQWLHILFLWPIVLWSVSQGFETLYVARSLVRLQGILVSVVITWFLVRISFWQMLRNILPSVTASAAMAGVAFSLRLISHHIVWQMVSIAICSLVYVGIMWWFPQERTLVLNLIKKRKEQ